MSQCGGRQHPMASLRTGRMLRLVRVGGRRGGEGPALAGVVGSGAKIDDEAAEELAGSEASDGSQNPCI
jgi:hypothetical protein